MTAWIEGNGDGAPDTLLEAEVRHCNEALKCPNEIVTGRFGEDGFYLSDGGELSWNWDIVRWREAVPHG